MILALIAGYLAGSIPFGLILTRLAGYGDIRKIGSGNIGATNVLRTGNKKLAALTLLLDGGKGAAVILICGLVIAPFPPALAMAAGLGAVLGHLFPVWLKFRGGKGVATTLGVLLAAAPWAGVAACLTWLVTAFVTRFSSLSALVAMLAAPVAALFLYGAPTAAIAAAISALVWLRHKDNIRRLLTGEEPKIGKKKTDVPATGSVSPAARDEVKDASRNAPQDDISRATSRGVSPDMAQDTAPSTAQNAENADRNGAGGQ